MNRLDWPSHWISRTEKLGWALIGVAVVIWLVFSSMLFSLLALAGAVMSLLFARRMGRTPMLAVENGELLCHISGGGTGSGGGNLWKTFRYPLADIDHVEEHLFPWGNGKARSKFVLMLTDDKRNKLSKTLGDSGIWLIPQSADERLRDQMRNFFKQHVIGGVTEKVMDQPPWKSSKS